jgi:hypothetical protein
MQRRKSKRPIVLNPATAVGSSLLPGYNYYDDFTTQLLDNVGGPLFSIYASEDPDELVISYPPGDFVVQGATVGAGGHDPGFYVQVFPAGANNWVFPTGYFQHYSRSAVDWTAITRLAFMVKPSVTVTRRSDGGDILQLGTYVRDQDETDAAIQGNHFYHLFDPTFYANKWHLIVMNRTPQHQVGNDPSTNWGDDPMFTAHGGHYFDELTRWYFDTQGTGFEGSTMRFKAFQIAAVSGQPDAEISSICALYTGTQYEVTWAGVKTNARTYEIRYSTSNLNSIGFTNGTDGGTTTNPASGYTGCIWQSGAMAENAAGMYIGIRVQSAGTFTQIYLPYQMGA